MEAEVLLFELDRSLFGIETEYVTEVLRAVAHSPLPGASVQVTGVINLRGRIIPVINTRKVLGFKEISVRHSDHFVVVRERDFIFALHLDRAVDLIRVAWEANDAELTALLPTKEPSLLVKRIVQADAGMVQILDLGAFLSSDDRTTLNRTMSVSTATAMQWQKP